MIFLYSIHLLELHEFFFFFQNILRFINPIYIKSLFFLPQKNNEKQNNGKFTKTTVYYF